jgi:hypothetical protein
VDLTVHPDAIDDRKGAVSLYFFPVSCFYELIKSIQFAAGLGVLSRLPEDSDLSKKLGDGAIALMYNSIPHVRFHLLFSFPYQSFTLYYKPASCRIPWARALLPSSRRWRKQSFGPNYRSSRKTLCSQRTKQVVYITCSSS